jgi:uncharacterized protein YajQ (UPF0234 family)
VQYGREADAERRRFPFLILPARRGTRREARMAGDNSFDVVSEVDMMEVSNAVQQAVKEIRQRFDFKGSVSDITLEKEVLTLTSDDESKLKSVTDIVQTKLVKRGVSLKAMEYGAIQPAAKGSVRQVVTIKKGIAVEKAKEIVKYIKGSGVKVQASIQEDQVRVSGKKRDDLQAMIQLLKGQDFGIDLQFTNFRSN